MFGTISEVPQSEVTKFNPQNPDNIRWTNNEILARYERVIEFFDENFQAPLIEDIGLHL